MYNHDTFLATRWQEEHGAVSLCHLPGGVFVGLTYDTAANSLLGLLSKYDLLVE